MFRTIVRMVVLTLVVVLGVNDVAHAQTPRDTGTTVLHTSRLFDSESGAMLENQDILVRERMIVEVGPALKVPPGAREIDLRGMTVLPGLIDAHTHLLYLEDVGPVSQMEGIKAVAVEGTPLRALHGAARARTFLSAGITTVRDLGNAGDYGDVALRTAINDGSVDGPRMFVSGPGISPEGGQFPNLEKKYRGIAEEEYHIVHNAAEAADAVRENVTYGANVIKIYSENTPNNGSLTVEEMRAIVAMARQLGVRVAAHATGNAGVWRAVEAGVNSIEHGYNVDDTTFAFMKKRGVMLVPTDIDTVTLTHIIKRDPQGGSIPPERVAMYLASGRKRLQRALKAGVTIAAGSDNYINSGDPQGPSAKRVLYAYARAGMAPVEVLKAATRTDAELLGMKDRLGVVKANALADIIAVAGDPLADIEALENVKFVMKEGTVYVGRE